jgi:hypothetical protein
MQRWLIIVLLGLMTAASCSRQIPAAPSVEQEYYFPQTGHTVRGEFWQFLQRYGGVESLGYPLTEEITVEGWTVQYFEKGRLERHPENEAAYRITVAWLGDLLHRRRPPISPSDIPVANDSDRRYFPKTGHTVSGEFLHYFDAHGGTVRFGLPISEPFLWQGQLTQDFQSARFFWTPGQDPPVTLEEIGRLHFKASGLDKTLLRVGEEKREMRTSQ